jgi:hypothetical protein
MTIEDVRRLAQLQGSLTFEYHAPSSMLRMDDLKTGEAGVWICSYPGNLERAYAWVQGRKARRNRSAWWRIF